jgi:hypothetical protein
VGSVPATLVLGPSGRPLLGLDNRPLIVAGGCDALAACVHTTPSFTRHRRPFMLFAAVN